MSLAFVPICAILNTSTLVEFPEFFFCVRCLFVFHDAHLMCSHKQILTTLTKGCVLL
ncbi:MAG: hypothetical protein IJV52_03940 [Prevotella sp.]|nr:hypothetical protein [Prevotella sp.]